MAQEKTNNHSHWIRDGTIYRKKSMEARKSHVPFTKRTMSEPALEKTPELLQRKKRKALPAELRVCPQVQWQVRQGRPVPKVSGQ